MEEGGFKGVAHLKCLEDTIELDQELSNVTSSKEEVVGVVRSCPNQSTGGPDGLMTQYLKTMIQPTRSTYLGSC